MPATIRSTVGPSGYVLFDGHGSRCRNSRMTSS